MINQEMNNVIDHIADTSYEIAFPSIQSILEDKSTQGKNSYICFFEGNLLSAALSSKKLRNVLCKAHTLFPDGISSSLLVKINKNKNIKRISGPTFLLKACEYGQKLGWKHFFYGASEISNKILIENLRLKFPDMIIVGSFSPPFRNSTASEESELQSMIEKSKPDLLWVALGSPKQEFWISDHLGKLNVPLMLGVGAAFDFHSGCRPWAPKFVRTIGMEWLFRIFTGGFKTSKRNLVCVSKNILFLSKSLLYSKLHSKKNK